MKKYQSIIAMSTPGYNNGYNSIIRVTARYAFSFGKCDFMLQKYDHSGFTVCELSSGALIHPLPCKTASEAIEKAKARIIENANNLESRLEYYTRGRLPLNGRIARQIKHRKYLVN